MSLGIGIQLLGNIVKLMRHKVKGETICILALLTIPKRIQIMRESSQKNFMQRNTVVVDPNIVGKSAKVKSQGSSSSALVSIL